MGEQRETGKRDTRGRDRGWDQQSGHDGRVPVQVGEGKERENRAREAGLGGQVCVGSTKELIINHI